MSQRIRLVAFDLDGTVLDGSRGLSERTAAALRTAHASGVTLVISTGRSLHTVPPELVSRTQADYILTSNGARLTRAGTGETLLLRPIGREMALQMLDALRAPGVSFSVQFAEAVAFERRAVWNLLFQRDADGHWTVGAAWQFLRMTRCIRSAAGAIREGKLGEIEKVVALCPDTPARDRAMALARSRFGAQAAATSLQDAEMTAPGVSKGAALGALCASLGIRREETAAMGDSGNDLPLKEAAGCFVAMGNATEDVKAAADLVTDSVWADGAATALERLLRP